MVLHENTLFVAPPTPFLLPCAGISSVGAHTQKCVSAANDTFNLQGMQ